MSGALPKADPGPMHTCGRCRLQFALVPTVDTKSDSHWWLCPSCHERLLGERKGANSRWT